MAMHDIVSGILLMARHGEGEEVIHRSNLQEKDMTGRALSAKGNHLLKQ
jgi:hypothetical protein